MVFVPDEVHLCLEGISVHKPALKTLKLESVSTPPRIQCTNDGSFPQTSDYHVFERYAETLLQKQSEGFRELQSDSHKYFGKFR